MLQSHDTEMEHRQQTADARSGTVVLEGKSMYSLRQVGEKLMRRMLTGGGATASTGIPETATGAGGVCTGVVTTT